VEGLEIRIAGIGGQGIIQTGTILSLAGMYDGKNVSQSSTYGPESRGTPSRTDVIFSDLDIDYPYIEKADILIVMAQKAYELYHRDLEEAGKLFYDSEKVKVDMTDNNSFAIPASGLAAKELNNPLMAGIIMLSSVIKKTGIISFDSLKKAIRESVPEYVSVNMKAVEIGASLT
jgi:2-oxoglutarate ferredoxin oxidoreductase subunit gamma